MTKRVMSEAAWEAHQRLFGRSDRPGTAFDPRSVRVLHPPPAQGTLLERRTVELVIPMPPSVNDAWHMFVTKGGSISKALTDEHRAFRREVVDVARIAAKGAIEPLAGRLALDVHIVVTNRRRMDIDNRVKPLQDALQAAGVYADDSQIDELAVRRTIDDVPAEYCRVKVREVA